ncbi:hypothetical protein FLP10_07170 [Agromyces intestinalis]|uniref:Uncharacterized protein n=1 Tax=Agromyces intestinalis TaxID=2592652 RepID=A0A5C1YDN7_9MICO|nr:hypothetical protein [Agromyces intestinalis]QEO14221.1 hypothetical protein FLP10_07170 [Agromyces intestinalis]
MITHRAGRITAARVALIALAVCLVVGVLLVQQSASIATDSNSIVWDWSGEPTPEVIAQMQTQQFMWALAVPASATLVVASAFGLLVIGCRALAVRWSHRAVERAAQRAADHAADVADTLRPIRPPAR